METQKRNSVICYLLAIAVPLALIIVWHAINTIYPNADCANYLETAQDTYLRFKSDGIIRGILSAYLERGWRPILFPLFAVPFLVITGGDIPLTVAITQILLYIFFLTYIYFISRDFLGPLRSLLCTIFIGSISWVVIFSYYFMSEMALMACSVAALYHLKKADLFKSYKHSIIAGLLIGIGSAIRPVEFILAFFIILIFMTYLSYKRKDIGFYDIITMAPVFISTGIFFLVTLYSNTVPIEVLFIFGMVTVFLSIIPLLLSRRSKLNRSYLTTFFLFNFIIIIWWLPKIRELYSWARETTGIVGALYHDQGKMSFLAACWAFFKNLAGFRLVVILGIFILGLLVETQKRMELLKRFIKYNAFAFAMIIPPVFMLSLTTDIAYRRAFVGFSVLLLVNAILAINRELILQKVRLFIFTILILAQLFIMSLYTFDLLPSMRGMLLPFFKRTAFPLKGGDPSSRFLEKLTQFPFYGHVEIAVFSLSQTQYKERPFDASALNLIAKKQGRRLRFSYPAVFADLNEGYNLILQQWDYAVVDITTGNPADDPYSRLTCDIIKRWMEDELEKVNLRYLSTIHTFSSWEHNYNPANDKTILLLEVMKDVTAKNSGVKEISASSLLFPSDIHASARYLMEEGLTIWHAASPPKYPEWVEITYATPTEITKLAIRAQDDSPGGKEHMRAPKEFIFQGSNEKERWDDLLKISNNVYKYGGEWKEWEVENNNYYLYYRVYITGSNDPNFLTVRQIRLSGKK
jgi:hypothetical protein